MGMDLKLLATYFRERNGQFLSAASLRLERDNRLFHHLRCPGDSSGTHPYIPENLVIGHYEDEGLRFDTTDSYGQRLTFTTPKLLKTNVVPTDFEGWNRAILAFVMALPADARIVLYWC